VHDQGDLLGLQLPADGRGLRAAERAQVEAGQVAVKNPVRVLNVGVPDEEDSGQCR
jgi:hypothetical protein